MMLGANELGTDLSVFAAFETRQGAELGKRLAYVPDVGAVDDADMEGRMEVDLGDGRRIACQLEVQSVSGDSDRGCARDPSGS